MYAPDCRPYQRTPGRSTGKQRALLITNGYGEFLRVENELYGISASRIFKELEQYEK